MSKSILVNCDSCGADRTPSNHWLLCDCKGTVMQFRPWDEIDSNLDGVLHLCGEGCAAKVLSRQISAWRVQ